MEAIDIGQSLVKALELVSLFSEDAQTGWAALPACRVALRSLSLSVSLSLSLSRSLSLSLAASLLACVFTVMQRVVG